MPLKPIRYTLFLITAVLGTACTKDRGTPDYGGFPEDVGKIMFTQCATSGCHNDASKDAAAGLSLESWDKMFEGGRNSAAVIPYRHDYSPLFLFSNVYSDLGHQLSPTMPYGRQPLSREQVSLIKDWINNGAPDRTGFVKFSDNPVRQKFYVSNQGCDVVTVVDAQTLLPMRYIDVGQLPGVEAPHMIRVSPDGQHWYVIFTASSIMQKFRTSDDELVATIAIPPGNWNTFTMSHDSKKAFIVDWSADGKVAYVDLENSSLIDTWQGSGLYKQPHGSAMSPAGDSLYLTAQSGNFVYKVSPNDPITPREVSLQPGSPPTYSSSLDIHEIAFTPDGSKYLVTCQGSSDVRIVQASNDSVLAIIPVAAGSMPSEISISASEPYAFITVMEDAVTFPGKRGSVLVLNYVTNTQVKYIEAGYQPHGIAVHDSRGLVYVANRNVTTAGPAPHHPSSCGGRNGYVTYINLNTLEPVEGKKLEVSADPYSIAVRP